jgi:Glycosyltransferase family 87
VAPVRAVQMPMSRLAALGLVVVSVVSTSVIVLAEPMSSPYALLVLLVVAFGALALVLALGSLRRWLGIGTVLALSGGLLLGSALAPARSSDDLWAYGMYGRIVVHHHENPYVHPPSDYPDDPLFEHVNVYWAGTTARYGPVFVGVSAAVAAVAGDHPLPTRLGFQLIAALAVFVALVLIARSVRSAAAVAIVGLNPVTAYMVVNAGHNDALVGLGLLAGVLLAKRDRHTLATLAFAAAAFVKATAGLALIAYFVWLVYRRGPRALVRPVAVTLAVTLPMVLVAGFRNVINPLLGARETVLPHAPWNLLSPDGIRHAFGYGVPELEPQERFSTWALVTVLAVAAAFVVTRLKEPTPLFVVAGALLAYLFASAYTAPWFAAWVLPLLALRWRWRVGVYALAFFAIVMIDDRFGRAVYPQGYAREETFQVLLANWINTLTMLVAIGGVVILLWYRRPGSTPEAAAEPGEQLESKPVAPA